MAVAVGRRLLHLFYINRTQNYTIYYDSPNFLLLNIKVSSNLLEIFFWENKLFLLGFITGDKLLLLIKFEILYGEMFGDAVNLDELLVDSFLDITFFLLLLKSLLQIFMK